MGKHICIFLRLVAYDDLLDFLIDILVCLRVRYGQEPCIFLRLAAYVIYVLLLRYAYMLVFSPIGKGNTCI
jgi:hypothetical protein